MTKLISLNLWGGHVLEPLLSFLKREEKIDIFCFQELYDEATQKMSDEDREIHLDLFRRIQSHLPNYISLFAPVIPGYGIGMLIKKDVLAIKAHGDVLIHENPEYKGSGPTHSRKLQWVTIVVKNKEVMLINVHGLWNGKGKGDSPERLAQSQKIRSFMDSHNMPMIICGDFNLRPDTESLNIIREGMEDLIMQKGITSTRTSFYPKEEKFADYIFTSSTLKVNTFRVLSDEVSDHAPLFLDFQVK